MRLVFSDGAVTDWRRAAVVPSAAEQAPRFEIVGVWVLPDDWPHQRTAIATDVHATDIGEHRVTFAKPLLYDAAHGIRSRVAFVRGGVPA